MVFVFRQMIIKGGIVMKRTKRSTLLMLITVMLVGILAAPTNMKQVKAATTMTSQQIANHCNSKVNTYYPSGYCLSFVADMFQQLGAVRSSACCAHDYGTGRIVSTASDNIPVGADVFFTGSKSTCSSTGNKCGHVAIYVGDGYIVHSYNGSVHKDRLTTVMNWSGYSYRGWGYHGNVTISGTSTPSSFDGTIRVSNPGSPYPVPTGILRSGSRGDSVRWIQKFANDIMGAGISVDGIYGNQTIYAVKVFQQQNGLTVDGIAGSQTISKMLSVWQNKATIKPLNLGNEFAAIILRTDIWKSIRNDGRNITLWDEKANAQYYWYFTRQSDGSYIIKSLYDGKAIDVQTFAATNGSNVYTYAEHGLENQRWFIHSSGNSYKLMSKLGNGMCLDVKGAGTANGTNIEIYQDNGSVAQQFSIYKISHSALKSVDIASGYSKTMTIGDKQTLKHSLSPSTTRCNMVKWVSSDSSVLSVDGNGVVTAKKEGTATVTCVSTYSGTIKDAVTIEVKKKEEVTTEKSTTEAPKPEVTTEKETTEAPKPEVTTEQQPETPKPEVPTTQPTETDDTTSDEDEVWDEDSDEYEEIDDFDDEDDWDMAEDDSVGVGSILTDTKNKCKVEVTCDVEGALTVDYLGTTQKKAKSITVPNSVTIDGNTYSVTGIADDAFSDETTLTKVTIGSNVQWIGDSAFRNCKKLKSIVIPKSVKTIGKNAFRNCKALKKITIKGTALTSVGKNAFKGVPKKATLVLPKSKIKEYKKLLKKAGLK